LTILRKITQSVFPNQIAETNMIGIAAGLTIGGKIHLQELSLTSHRRV
jgi:transketolase C-terminal domain/subunit